MVATATTDLREAAPEEYPELRVDPALREVGQAPGIVSLRSAASPAPDERVPAFSINGTVYTIAARTKANTGLKYIHLARTRGQEIAIDFMLETLLGAEGYEALREFDDLTEADLEAVIKAASRIMAGAVDPKEKQPRGPRRSAG
jgi:hypothetical protein